MLLTATRAPADPVTVATFIEEKFAKLAVDRLSMVKTAFDRMDTDGSGYLSVAEFTQVRGGAPSRAVWR